MYARVSAILLPIALVGLIGAGVWGYQENREKNAVLIKAENQYQRAFHDLSFHLDKLHTELGNTLAVNSASQDSYRKGLVNVWRITSEAQNEINQLPLTLLPFNKTEEFLDNMAKFSYRTAVRDLGKNPLSQDEVKTLTTLYERSKEITGEMRGVQNKIIANNLRWMDVEVAMAQENKTQDNTIIDGFTTVNRKVSEYSEVDWGPSMATVNQNKTFSALAGTDASPDQVKKQAASFLKMDANQLKVVENGAGTEANTYSVTGKRPDGQEVHVDYTKKGGQLIWYMAPRTAKEKKLDVRAARDKAMEFLDQHGFGTMEPVALDEYANVATITFANKKDGVIVYPEKMVVEVAMDNGDVTSFNSTDYIFEHNKDRKFSAPAVSEEKARKSLNPNFKVERHQLALIKGDMDQEVLCREFMGRINGGLYKIYLNAENGTEEKIENVRQQDVQAAR
ncbi:germination protein YpeB [Paenibacillus sp. J31TS4]|uniref:germination protein YpeB n=1 Tax=Paenibacillus sp. J31TS4 TaxID=2807195 RepID=UPI001B1FE764|nr:germination protein YpeB [Paenibacillus sp. J31TS4]GIP37496.1 germination protein YpeB [Paenibacillus sp. J31TS4]